MIKSKIGYQEDTPNKDNVYAQPRAFEFTYYLSDCIQNSHEYHELLQLLDTSSENDVIRLIINNEGGDVSTCVQIVQHIRNSPATVVGVLSGNAFSAAAVIWMACDEYELDEHCMLMIHSANGFVSGKYVDMTKYLVAANRRTKEFYEDVFEGFLSEDEIDTVLKGDEMWLLSDEIIERLGSRKEYIQKMITKQQEEQMEAIDAAYADMFGDEPTPPADVLLKLTKPQLVAYINGEINVSVDDNGKLIITKIAEAE